VKRFFALIIVIVFVFTSKVFAAAPAEYINDQANILSQEQKTQLNTLINENQKQTGNEVAVLIIPELKNETIESQAVKTFEDWGIGKKGKDNGVLLLVAIKDKKLRIEVGYGLEGVLTDLRSSQIIGNIITPEFKSGNYYLGIEKGLNSIIATINSDSSYNLTIEKSNTVSNDNLFGIIIFLGYIIFQIITRTKSWWLGGVLGAIVGLIVKSIPAAIGLTLLGLLIDFLLSKLGQNQNFLNILNRSSGRSSGGGWGGGSSFGGFGGGRSGGGGSSGSW